MGELVLKTLQALAVSLGFGAVVIFITLVVSMFAIRNKVQGQIWLEFVEPNNDITGGLYKPSSDTVAVKNPDKSKTEYLINPARQFRKMYPPGWPQIVQEPVVAQMHIRGKSEPLALRDEKIPATSDTTLRAIKTATIMRNLTERAERMAQAGKLLGGSKIMPLLIVLTLAAAVVAAWFTYSMSSQIDKILSILGG